MKKKVQYHINRYMTYTTDYVQDYITVDKFDDLKTAREYLKGLIKLLDKLEKASPLFYGHEKVYREIESFVHKYGQNGGDSYRGVENKITRVTTVITEVELKGI